MLNPDLLSNPKSLCTFGFLRSPPRITVLYPADAKISARLVAQNVLPSEAIDDVTDITLFFSSAARYWILVLSERKDSDKTDLGLFVTTMQ